MEKCKVEDMIAPAARAQGLQDSDHDWPCGMLHALHATVKSTRCQSPTDRERHAGLVLRACVCVCVCASVCEKQGPVSTRLGFLAAREVLMSLPKELPTITTSRLTTSTLGSLSKLLHKLQDPQTLRRRADWVQITCRQNQATQDA